MSSEQLKKLVFLTQTDTTIGFISQNADKLTQIKQRPPYKHYIKALPSLQKLKSFTRVPEKHKNRVRRAKRATFVFPDGYSYRIIREPGHLQLIKKFGWMYTTSANLSGDEFDETFAREAADVIVGSPSRRDNYQASSIVKLNNIRMKRIR
ncbi:MAG: Sua5 YciO YrdC YwlC family protein [Campylobacterota bacterium]|nr:Sua5 YciO YrdC YwlC family protein [Campylobacterota bacterium]